MIDLESKNVEAVEIMRGTTDLVERVGSDVSSCKIKEKMKRLVTI